MSSVFECYEEDSRSVTRSQCRVLQQQHGDIDCIVNPRWEKYNARTVAQAIRDDPDVCVVIKRNIGTLEDRMVVEKAKAGIVAASPPTAQESRATISESLTTDGSSFLTNNMIVPLAGRQVLNAQFKLPGGGARTR
eukprot:TRINITY_DN6653_c0_g1_i3.p1 TRINITY_DN6653_c0_g1~~TRINITY_DN6653_c0_g1_i3.p1  ORF type:complete len:136 (+),score=19.98 TRINITY_DN6653_c0_g1_i3:65-472(+)